VENLRVSRRASRTGFGAVAFLLLALILPGSLLAQKAAGGGASPSISGPRLTARAAADRSLNLHVTFRLRNREALSKLLQEVQDPASPRYHRWLTSQQFEAQFGRTPEEVNAVSQWLSTHGLKIVRSSNREIVSAATVARAEGTFATTIAASGDGVHFSNTSAPQIPTRFADVIGSIEGLDNLRHWVPVAARPATLTAGFSARNPARLPGRGPWAPSATLTRPADSSTGPNFGPQDLWTFYDETPPINGALDGRGGDCIGIIQDSDYLDNSVTTFDSSFSLPPASLTRIFSDGSSPGTNSDETEALVDIEWSHSTAPGAPINVYIGNEQFQDVDPLTDGLLRAVSDNACGTISFTYVFCGAAPSFYSETLGNAFTQAALQGQTMMAATGDWGSAGLVDNNNACVTASTQNVSEVATNPNVTAVGGTQFVPNYDAQGNDIGSVPEMAWNNGAGATGGGKSTVFPKPSYQNPVTPADGVRDVPDVSAGASNTTPGFYWVDDSDGVPVVDCCIGGTSIATPMWAGFSKLIAQLAGRRLGNMNPRIYTLGPLADASRSGLRDVVGGNNGFNGVPGFNAVAGYDLATGWGSPDVQTFEAAFLSTSIPPSPTPTATPTPSSGIVFVGASPLADSSTAVTAVTVSAPTGVERGDLLVAQIIVHDGTAADVPSPPSGWSSIRHDAVDNLNQETSWLYYKIAGANEPPTYTWSISSNFAAGVLGVWRGTSAAPVANSSGTTADGLTPISASAPSLTPGTNHDLEIYFYSSQASAAPTLTLSNALTQRLNLASSQEGFSLAFADVSAPFAGNASPTYPATASSSSFLVMTAQAVLITSGSAPASTPTPTVTATATPTAVATTKATSIATTIPTRAATSTATVAATLTPTATATLSATSTITASATPVASQSATPVPTPTPVSTGARIVAPSSMNVGSIGIGLSTTKSFSIKNSGVGNLTGSLQVSIADPSQASVFSVAPDSFNIAPKQSQSETVTFAPNEPSNSAALIISSNDGTQPTVGVRLTGTGLTGKLKVPGTFTIMGPVGQTIPANLVIKNAGQGILSGDWAGVTILPYHVDPGSFVLQPGMATSIPFSFTPTAEGNAPTVVLAIGVIAPGTGSTTVTLKGIGK
jgi:hypothetical protein